MQALLNAHTYEEDFHWQWMLRDLEKLAADGRMPLSEAARVFWGTEFAHSRRLAKAILEFTRVHEAPCEIS